jgi:hypothetical protein
MVRHAALLPKLNTSNARAVMDVIKDVEKVHQKWVMPRLLDDSILVNTTFMV